MMTINIETLIGPVSFEPSATLSPIGPGLRHGLLSTSRPGVDVAVWMTGRKLEALLIQGDLSRPVTAGGPLRAGEAAIAAAAPLAALPDIAEEPVPALPRPYQGATGSPSSWPGDYPWQSPTRSATRLETMLGGPAWWYVPRVVDGRRVARWYSTDDERFSGHAVGLWGWDRLWQRDTIPDGYSEAVWGESSRSNLSPHHASELVEPLAIAHRTRSQIALGIARRQREHLRCYAGLGWPAARSEQARGLGRPLQAALAGVIADENERSTWSVMSKTILISARMSCAATGDASPGWAPPHAGHFPDAPWQSCWGAASLMRSVADALAMALESPGVMTGEDVADAVDVIRCCYLVMSRCRIAPGVYAEDLSSDGRIRVGPTVDLAPAWSVAALERGARWLTASDRSVALSDAALIRDRVGWPPIQTFGRV